MWMLMICYDNIMYNYWFVIKRNQYFMIMTTNCIWKDNIYIYIYIYTVCIYQTEDVKLITQLLEKEHITLLNIRRIS